LACSVLAGPSKTVLTAATTKLRQLRKVFTPGRLAAAGLILLALVAGLLLLIPASNTYIFLPDRARPVEPLIKVEGAKDEDDAGGIFFVDVIVRRATWMERLFPSIRDGATLVPARALNPTGVSDDARRAGNLREMTRSQSIAAAVALRELGYKVKVRTTGALISAVAPDSPASRGLRPGDVVVDLDGQPVRTRDALRRLIRRKTPGEKIRLDIRRGSKLEKVTLTTAPDARDPNRSMIGVLVEDAVNIDLPISVRIDTGDVGGPSAGLAFALAVLEELGRDVDHGYKVAVTGEIALNGSVRPVGGVRQKTIGAERSDVDLFLVPAGENAEEARREADGIRVVAVKSFQQTLRELATLPQRAQN
jgi:PDZ domain-containing protein